MNTITLILLRGKTHASPTNPISLCQGPEAIKQCKKNDQFIIHYQRMPFVSILLVIIIWKQLSRPKLGGTRSFEDIFLSIFFLNLNLRSRNWMQPIFLISWKTQTFWRTQVVLGLFPIYNLPSCLQILN